MATIVIATNKVPKAGFQDQLILELHRLAATHLCTVEAVFGTPGPGCYNYAIQIEGMDVEGFAGSAVAAFFPARWTYTHDKIEGFKLEGL